MEAILTYIIQVNLLLSLLFIGYQLLLKNLTFYTLNRAYFLIGSLYAFIYPFLNFKDWFAQKIELPQGIILDYIPFSNDVQDKFSLTDLLVYIVGLGAVILFLKLMIQLCSLARIHWYSKPSQWRDYIFRNVIFPITPFSFFNKIYIHKEQHQDIELNDIFKHENVHVKGHHSIDVLLFEVVLLICWYNPFVWLMRKTVRQNLEFLTDQQVLDKGVDRQTYQYSLLNVSRQGAQVGLSNQFNFNNLKKRIMMMNKKRSSQLELSKYVFLLPALILAGITFTVKQAEAKIDTVVVKMTQTDINDKINTVIGKEIAKTRELNLVVENDTNKVDTVKFFNTKEYADYDQSDNVDNKTKLTSFIGVRATNGKEPLVVVDGKKIPNGKSLRDIDPNNIESISVLKKASGELEEYGDEGKNGVIIIKTKDATAAKEGNPKMSISGDTLKGKLGGLTVKGIGKVRVENNISSNAKSQGLTFKNPADTSIKVVVWNTENEGFKHKLQNNLDNVKEMLILLDGKPISYKNYENIDLQKIENVTVLKDEAATAVYGEKAKNGILFISSKRENQQDQLQELIVVGRPSVSNESRQSQNVSNVRIWTPESTADLYNPDLHYIIDGKKSTFEKFKKLRRDEIGTVTKLGKEAASSLYGKRGEKGAVIITTKVHDKKSK